jgi:hypothetical protein
MLGLGALGSKKRVISAVHLTLQGRAPRGTCRATSHAALVTLARFSNAAPLTREIEMTQSIRREVIAETLLNTLEAERYVRGPLLLAVVDELSTSVRLARAAGEARAIFEAYAAGKLVESDFVPRIRALRQLVKAA